MSTFRPVGFRLPLSEVAALAAATAVVLLCKADRNGRFRFGFRLQAAPAPAPHDPKATLQLLLQFSPAPTGSVSQ